MKISDWFIPKYLHSNPDVRLKFVNNSNDAHLLRQMSEKDKDVKVREAAAERVKKLRTAPGQHP
jgi:hypothetical protein